MQRLEGVDGILERNAAQGAKASDTINDSPPDILLVSRHADPLSLSLSTSFSNPGLQNKTFCVYLYILASGIDAGGMPGLLPEVKLVSLNLTNNY